MKTLPARNERPEISRSAIAAIRSARFTNPIVFTNWFSAAAFAFFAILHCSIARTADAQWNFPRGNLAASGVSPHTLPKDLAVAWEFRADEAIEAAPIISGDRVFAGDVFGTLYAVARKDGSLIWKKPFDTGFLASPVVVGDRLVIGDIEGNIYVLSVEDGRELWKATADGEISGSATVYKNRVLVASQDGKLYCFNLKDGKSNWVYQANDQIRCAPTVAGNLTFLGGCDAQLHIVDITTGKAVGETLPLDGPTGSTPAVEGNTAILPIMDGSVFAFDWKNKKQLWRYEDLEQNPGVSKQCSGHRSVGHCQQPAATSRCDRCS